MIRLAYLWIIFLLCPLQLRAQAELNPERLVERLHLDSARASKVSKVDSIWAYRYKHSNVDTAYLRRPHYYFTAKVRGNFSGNSFNTHGRFSGFGFTSHLESPHRMTSTFGISYRGLGISLSLNPAKIAGRDHDTEINLNAYSNRIGVDVVYQDAKTFSGWNEVEGTRTELPTDFVQIRLLSVNAYYVFNHRRFSYPAAFTQSYIQRRSAGSWMLGLSFLIGELGVRADSALHNPTMNIRIGNIGLGGGYGYNWVFPHRWLLHVSALPTLVVGSFNRLTINSERQNMPYAFPEFIMSERFALSHLFNERHFLTLTATLTHSISGDIRDFRIHYNRWRINICYGFRF